MSPVHRIHKSEAFAQIPNDTLRDNRLSYRARGILAMVLTHSDHWDVDKDFIESQGTEGDVAITSAFRELEALGYRRVVRSRDGQGRITTQVHWYETPPVPELSGTGDSGTGNSGDLRTPPQNTNQEHPSPPLVVTSPPVPPATERGAAPTTVTDETVVKDDDGFEEFWRAFPRKERQVVTRAAYRHALESTDPNTLLAGAKGYARKITRDGTEPRYIQTADRWLREERWTDDYAAPRADRPWYHVAE